ncbi:bifunctional 2',3'-cyclic-nucleotide 2'-phosphodiesterase/3'-nucleotidase [Paenibacillus sp. MMS18-CY102]|uniref:bifunctional 2',3'-cyclic-nucleotide 2'-phosphodiesterase/3'-nucleotidase n=1 Tax=Paenibacillus sp. MMS18-CY102 TaxID=2682849 RepID=UPI001365A00D|nr:bifunctional 2',3'-cyclic-nucleotide 2'-phosphodiesterase/3'-nucleotidase [Paenibacillus sp. MMS18-CY102]MWC26823.1 bifunctional 2',3'-cyclic-nucleotide 2'-phosphodiesterase/3'-nucleotidase [Paenibacillus sp. MMS18-CY102]
MSRLTLWKGALAAVAVISVIGTIAVPTSVLGASVSESASASAGATVMLRVLETTDLHVNLMNYDYFADKPTVEYGLTKTATLIKQARAESPNSLLFDNGDLIQGNPLGDYVAKVAPLKKGETHPVYKAMNLLDYDAGNIGNHEFNYGLDFLQTSLQGAKFPYVNANLYVDDHDNNAANDKHYFTPYLLLDRTVTDTAGAKHTIKVGVIGFVPPQVMQWDKANLQGKVIAKDIVETAKKLVPEMKAKGADLIVALPHSGFEDIPQTENMENSVLYLSQVPDINVILFGHAHKVFPSAAFEGKKGVDLAKGTINGVPAVEPGFWGNNLGVVDLELSLKDGNWAVQNSKVDVRPIYDAANKKALVDVDHEIADAVESDHNHTLEYIRGPVGTAKAPINSFFALVQDDPSIQIVTSAQKWYVEQHLQGTEYEGLPVLSAGAPFKAGGRQGPSYYTNIPAGKIAIKNVADLYLYSNTVNAVVLTGAEIKEWLEWSAGQFNTIDPKGTSEQPLVNENFPTYNFDVIDGLNYQIDVTQQARYDAGGKLVAPNAHRIQNIAYKGKPLDLKQKFIVATNNYRASSSTLANPDGKRIVLASPDENRQAVIDYIKTFKTIDPAADGNWSFLPIKANVNVTFKTSPDAKAFAAKLATMKYVGDTEDGYAKYKLSFEGASGANVTAVEPGQTAKPAAGSAPSPAEAGSKPSAGTGSTATSAAPSPVGQTPTAKDKVYIVKAGDTLSQIALRHGTTWQKLADYNNLRNPNLIYPGQRISIPAN